MELEENLKILERGSAVHVIHGGIGGDGIYLNEELKET